MNMWELVYRVFQCVNSYKIQITEKKIFSSAADVLEKSVKCKIYTKEWFSGRISAQYFFPPDLRE